MWQRPRDFWRHHSARRLTQNLCARQTAHQVHYLNRRYCRRNGSLSVRGLACSLLIGLHPASALQFKRWRETVPVPVRRVTFFGRYSTLKAKDPTGAPVTSSGFSARTNDLSALWCTGRQRTDACATARCCTAQSTTPATSPAMVTLQTCT